MTRPARATPGQLGLGGAEVPEEQPDRKLITHGFKGWRDQGSMLYTDPFDLKRHLTRAQARKLLSQRMDDRTVGGFRVRHPQDAWSEVRIGPRRATMEGAWHELHAASGKAKPGPGYWIIDGSTNARVWPPSEPALPRDADDPASE